MSGIIVVGCQWGDEGKGKVADFYAKDAWGVVRYQGGCNAGHTVEAAGKTYKFHLLPSGAVYGRRLFIGAGVVIDPAVLFREIDEFGKKPRLMIDGKAHVTLPFHRELDGLEEKMKGAMKAGTTGRGIGPTYSDKVARFGVRVCDLLNMKTLMEKISTLAGLKEAVFEKFGQQYAFDTDGMIAEYMDFGERMAPMIGDVSLELNRALDSGRKILFEGAQGTLLDIDHGVYPYTTSSNTTAGGACTGTGVGPRRMNKVIGVAKAYTTRVGEGPLPTELLGDEGDALREAGHEYGTTTGRPRRCGWLDLVTLRYAARVNSLDGLAVTKLDVLGGMPKLKVCVKYKRNGKTIMEHPSKLEGCEPVYAEMKGWEQMPDEDWRKIAKKGMPALPAPVREYVKAMGKLSGVPVYLVSVGAARESTISLRNVWI